MKKHMQIRLKTEENGFRAKMQMRLTRRWGKLLMSMEDRRAYCRRKGVNGMGKK